MGSQTTFSSLHGRSLNSDALPVPPIAHKVFQKPPFPLFPPVPFRTLTAKTNIFASPLTCHRRRHRFAAVTLRVILWIWLLLQANGCSRHILSLHSRPPNAHDRPHLPASCRHNMQNHPYLPVPDGSPPQKPLGFTELLTT